MRHFPCQIGACEPMMKINRRVATALVCYAVLIAAALVTLLPVRTSDEKFILGVVLVVFALLIVKTLVHAHGDDDDKME